MSRRGFMPGGGGGNMNKMMKEMQKMQKELEKSQAEIEEKEVSFQAGGGMVEAVVNGKKEVVSLTIDPDVMDPEDVEIVQDMIVAAVNGALAEIEEITSSEMSKFTGGLGIPGL